MDPVACWQRFIDACTCTDRDEAIYALEDLLEWIRKGGCMPQALPHEHAIGNLLAWITEEL